MQLAVYCFLFETNLGFSFNCYFIKLVKFKFEMDIILVYWNNFFLIKVFNIKQLQWIFEVISIYLKKSHEVSFLIFEIDLTIL